LGKLGKRDTFGAQFTRLIVKKRGARGRGKFSGHVVAMGIQGLARDLGNNALKLRVAKGYKEVKV
jgi:hypothetical protein